MLKNVVFLYYIIFLDFKKGLDTMKPFNALCVIGAIAGVSLVFFISTKTIDGISRNALADAKNLNAVYAKNFEEHESDTAVQENITDDITSEKYAGYPNAHFDDTRNVWIYDVQWGDTLSDISKMFGRSIDSIAEYNHIQNVDLIYAESSIVIP